MERILALLAVVGLAAFLMGAETVNGTRCTYPISMTDDYTEFFEVGARDTKALDVSFEPNAAGSGGSGVLGLEFCSREDPNTCNAYNFDSDADGLGDTNLLDASTIEKSGVKGIAGFRYLRIYAATNGGSGETPEFTVCRQQS